VAIAAAHLLSGFGAGYYEKKSTLGRRLPAMPAQAELKRRARLLVKVRQEHSIDEKKAAAVAADYLQASFKPDVAAFIKGFQLYGSAESIGMICISIRPEPAVSIHVERQ
jgi:hypothetical protein